MSIALVPITQLRTRLDGALVRYRYGVSALDQIALSVFGFGLNLCLVRALSATDYGIVTLWMTMALLAIGIQDALVNTPLSTHLPAAPDPASARRLAEAIAVVNLLVIGLTTASVVLVNLFVDAEWAAREFVAAVAIPVFVAAGMYREFYRSIAFSRNDMAMLLWIDAPYLAVTTLCLAAMLAWPEWFANLAVAFFAMSAGCIVGRLCLRGRFRGPELSPFQRGWWPAYRRIVHDAGWALIGVLTTHLHARSYVYVIVNMVGLAGLAAVNVVGLLFRPVRIMATSWGRAALPELATHLAAGRIAAFDRAIVRAFAAACVGSGGWFLALWLGWHLIERHFLAGNYPDAWSLMWPAAIAAALDAMSYTVSIGLRATREFKFLAYVTMLTAPVTIGATVGAVLWQGYTWTMYGVAFGSLVGLAIEGGRLYSVRRRALVQPGPT
jgi:O-antigen/teichoic acid export membrane protein